MNKLILAPIKKIIVDTNLRSPGWKKKVEELKPSIKALGLQQPILVIPLQKKGPKGETFELIYGSRRLEACKQLKHTTIKALVGSEKMSRKEKLLAKLAENDDRKDLTAIEQAEAYKQVIDECKLNARELSKAIGRTDGFVSQRLALLKLTSAVQTALQKETITPTHARELARFKDPKQQDKHLKKAKETENASDFKAAVDTALNKKRDKTKPHKGRPEKKEKETKSSRQSEDEIEAGVSRMEKQLKAAVKAKNEIHKAHLQGIVRGISWAVGTTGATLPNLYTD